MVTVKDVVKYINNVLGYCSNYTDENIEGEYYRNFLNLLGVTDYGIDADKIITKGQLGAFLSGVFGSLGAPSGIRDQIFRDLSGNYMLNSINKFDNMANYKTRLDTEIRRYNAYDCPFHSDPVSWLATDGSVPVSFSSPGWYSFKAEGGNGRCGGHGMIYIVYTTELARRWLKVSNSRPVIEKEHFSSRDNSYGECEGSVGIFYSLGEQGLSGDSCKVSMPDLTVIAAGGRGGCVTSVGLDLISSDWVTISRQEPIYGTGPSGGRVQTGSKTVTTREYRTNYAIHSGLFPITDRFSRNPPTPLQGANGVLIGRRTVSGRNIVEYFNKGCTPYGHPYGVFAPEGGEIRTQPYKWYARGSANGGIVINVDRQNLEAKTYAGAWINSHLKWSRDYNGRSYDYFDRRGDDVTVGVQGLPQGSILKLG